MALKLSIQALRNYLKLLYQYQLHSLPDTKVKTVKDPGKNYMNIRPPLVHHLYGNRLLKIGQSDVVEIGVQGW